MNTIQSSGIARTLYHAAASNPRGPGALMSEDAFASAVTRLWQLFDDRQIEAVLVGGIAVLQYISGRNTEDIDLIVSVDDLALLPELTIHDQNDNFARASFDGLRIYLLLTRNPLFARVASSFTDVGLFAGTSVRFASVNGLILLKAYELPSLYRAGDFARVGLYENDLATLIQAYHPDVAALIGILADYLQPSDLDALRDILDDINRRIVRFESGLGDQET